MDHTHTKFNNPKIIGPGIWYLLHERAFNVISYTDKITLVEDVKRLQINFPCVECGRHMGEYMKTFDIIDSINIESGLFIYLWKFHNAVNVRLNKPTITLEDAKTLFDSGSGFCITGCDEGGESQLVTNDKIKRTNFLSPY